MGIGMDRLAMELGHVIKIEKEVAFQKWKESNVIAQKHATIVVPIGK